VTDSAKYLTGLSATKAKIGRFGYAEKMEYWAVVWGTIIMGVTGLMIWFKMDVTKFLPRWAVDVATTIHYYEAILACLAIVVWHFYHVIFDPDVYPLNWPAGTARSPSTGRRKSILSTGRRRPSVALLQHPRPQRPARHQHPLVARGLTRFARQQPLLSGTGKGRPAVTPAAPTQP